MKRKYIKTLKYIDEQGIVCNDYDKFINEEIADLSNSGYNVIDVKSNFEYNNSIDSFMLCTIFYEKGI